MSDAPTNRMARFYARGEQLRGLSPMMLTDGNTAELRLYDVIDSWGAPFGVSAKEFAAVLDGLPEGTTQINLHVNSPGGEAFDALAIMNSLRSHPANVTVTVDGIAASAASFIAAGADETVMMPNSELMVHDAWGLAIGNAADMHKMAADLDHLSDNIADVYATKSGGTVEDWRAVMAAETWLSAQEAVDAGLADSVAKPSKTTSADKAKARFDLSVFNYAGREHAPAPHTPVALAPGDSPTPQEGSPAVAFSDEGTTTLRQQLGVSEDADEATILAALTEALTERADDQPQTPQVVPGTVTVDEEQYNSLVTQARMGVEAREQQFTEERERLVVAAVQDGRIPPARKDAWRDMLKVDPGAKDVLSTMKPGLVPVAALGNDQINEMTEDDATFVSLFGDESKGA